MSVFLVHIIQSLCVPTWRKNSIETVSNTSEMDKGAHKVKDGLGTGELKEKKRKHKTESIADKQILKKLKLGENVNRSERQLTDFEKFREQLEELDGSVPISVIKIKCGVFKRATASDSYHSIDGKIKYFRKNHFDTCKKNSLPSTQSTSIATFFKKETKQ